jgi:hypothetical protein
MADIQTAKSDEPGRTFMIGVGPVGAMLLDIIAGPCLRIDDLRWSMNTARGNLVLSHKRVERLLEDGWVVVAPEKLMEREHLILTDKGGKEVFNFALLRSMELASIEPPSTPTVSGAEPLTTTQSLAFDLAQKAFELAYRKRGELPPGCRLVVADPEGGEPKELCDWIKGDDEKKGARMARLFAAIEALADSSIYGLTIGEMPAAADWGAAIASEAFRRAPDQDWEFGEGE